MGRLGVLKPLRGTESSLANIVLEDGEIAFSYPTTGPGTGLGGIKMGDGIKTFSSLPWYITGEGSGPTPDPWQYDTGTNEAALLNNIKHCEQETIGKIYYIQSYWYNGSSSVITDEVPYMVIDINHEDTDNTIDLMCRVRVNHGIWNSQRDSWTYGKYTTSSFYSWISITCPMGYSNNIYAKMCNMTERWREAIGTYSGELQTRQTKCKMLNPYELFGNTVGSWKPSWSGSVYVTDFTTYDYGQHYSSIFSSDTTSDLDRIIYTDLAMNSPVVVYTNSYYATSGAPNYSIYINNESGGITDSASRRASNSYLYATVIRLSDTP